MFLFSFRLQCVSRLKTKRYWPQPSWRKYIPKDEHSKRPLGLPALEDKIVQKGVARILEAIYEQDFLDCSHGFRRGRSAHGALDALWNQTMDMGGGWVLEIDFASYFDTIDRGHLQQILRQRVRDGVLIRLIGKWLKAGVMEDGCVYHPETGTPQGGVLSPLLANIFLHEVLDMWFEREVKPRLSGAASLIRFADDGVPRRRRREANRAN